MLGVGNQQDLSDGLECDPFLNTAMQRFTLYNVCAVPWGCSVLWGVFSTVGGYHEYRGGYHEYRGGYLEYRGVFSTVGGIMINVGGYLEYHGGCSVPWGIS